MNAYGTNLLAATKRGDIQHFLHYTVFFVGVELKFGSPSTWTC